MITLGISLSSQDVSGRYLVVHRPGVKDYLTICEAEVESYIKQINVSGTSLPQWVDLTAINDGKLTSCSILGWRMWPADGIIELARTVVPFKQAEIQLYGMGINTEGHR